MSSAEDIGKWDEAVQAYDNGGYKEAIEKFGSMATVSSKISFNIGSAYLMLNETGDAFKHFKEAVQKDNHLAIGYYMSGICCLERTRYNEALEQFEKTIKSMRGNKTVDYKQLGLKYQLNECEVLMNQAVIHSKTGAIDTAKELLLKAIQVKVEKKHEKIEESLTLLQHSQPLEPMVPPSGVIFRPPSNAVKNLKKKDYLGQAKVLYTANPEDNKAGFSGLKLLEESRQDLLSAIRKPDRKRTLRKISVCPENKPPVIELGRVVDKAPPRKPLPRLSETQERDRAETWHARPTKPLPKMVPRVPANNSPILQKEQSKNWTGKPSTHSAFKENTANTMPNSNKANTTVRPPRKPLPNLKSKNGPSDETQNKETKKLVDVEIQFNFTSTIKASEDSTVEEIRQKLRDQEIPHGDLCVFYMDGLGRQRKLTDVALDHVLQGSMGTPKLLCFPK